MVHPANLPPVPSMPGRSRLPAPLHAVVPVARTAIGSQRPFIPLPARAGASPTVDAPAGGGAYVRGLLAPAMVSALAQATEGPSRVDRVDGVWAQRVSTAYRRRNAGPLAGAADTRVFHADI